MTGAYDSVHIERSRVWLLHSYIISPCHLVPIVVWHLQFQKNYFLDSSPSHVQASTDSLPAHQCTSAAMKTCSLSHPLAGDFKTYFLFSFSGLLLECYIRTDELEEKDRHNNFYGNNKKKEYVISL